LWAQCCLVSQELSRGKVPDCIRVEACAFQGVVAGRGAGRNWILLGPLGIR
jgi:hypothetical protein